MAPPGILAMRVFRGVCINVVYGNRIYVPTYRKCVNRASNKTFWHEKQ